YEAATNSVEYPLIYDEGQRYSQAAASLSPDSRVDRVIRTGEPILEHVSREDWQAMTTVANPVGNTSKPSASLLYVPLKRGEEIIGVLSVQSYQFNAYTREHTDLLNSVANQLAVAILNARLFEQTSRAVDELDALNRRLTGEAWHTYAQTRSPDAVIWHANDPALTQLGQAQAEQLAAGTVAIQPSVNNDEVEVSVPITLRGQLIGALRFLVPAGKWTDESQSIAMSIAGHLAQAAENTRLIEQTQLIAQRDRAIATAAERIRRSTDINAILQAAVEEINRYTVTDGISLQIGFEAAAPNGARPKEQVEL
ncbi:MAG: GAF domain-containing protein, partial [Thermoflexales bacterium]|nr:GAF domain-containing protein [Thermoflexales bacterium]